MHASPSGRRRARRGTGGQLREQLIAAAGEILRTTGDLKRLTVREVANRAGVTTPSIYLHFSDKDALLDVVIARVIEQLGERLDRAASGAASPRDALERRGREYVKFAAENPEAYHAAMTVARPDVDALLEATVLQPIIELFGELAQSVERPTMQDPATEALYLWASLHGLTSMLIAKPLLAWGDATRFVDRAVHDACWPPELRSETSGACPPSPSSTRDEAGA